MSWLKSKIRMVAARASDALAQAADIVAPTLYESRVDEFHHRWITVARFLETIMTRDLDEHEQRRQLLESHTRDSLQKLVLLIFAEENATDADLARVYHYGGADGDSDAAPSSDPQPRDQASRACLEYLLERQIIPHLCDVGRRDQPSGIMALALQFVGALLSRVNHPILPTREVHVSVVALIQAATKREVDDPIVRKCLIILLNVLWKKLRCDPVQTEFFFLHADRRATETTGKGSNGMSELVLFTGLLPHMYANQKTGEKCREALVIAASVHEPALCRFILKLTPFCHYAVNGVISAFDALPKALPDKLRRSSAGTTNSNNGSNGNATTTAGGGSSLDVHLQFLATRLRFCCTLVMVGQYELSAEEMANTAGMECQPSISSEILTQFRLRFLEGPLLEGLMHTSEDTARTATLYARIILEELAACCRDTNANPLLLLFVQFLVQPTLAKPVDPAVGLASAPTTEPAAASTASERRLPMELMHRMDSLSSSLSIATVDLFTSLLELQNDFVDRRLLGNAPAASDIASSSLRKASVASLSPRMQMNSAIWLACRFPESAVAANAHIWKIQAFDTMASHVEIPVSSPNDSDTSEDQIVSLLSYIADAEFVTCQRAPAVLDGFFDSDDDEEALDGGIVSGEKNDSDADKSKASSENGAPPPVSNSSSSSRTAATRNAMKPLKELQLTMSLPSYSPVPTALRDVNVSLATKGNSVESALFVRLVLNRLERVLESSFYENLALSGLISVLAQKPQCASVVFDAEEVLGSGESTSFRAVLEEVHADALRRTSRLANGHARLAEIRRKLVEENNEASLNDHEPETRLLCGYVVVEEILKELCSILFAKDRVRSLPVKPEGYYLEPKRISLSRLPRVPSSETLLSLAASNTSAPLSIGEEFEQLIADAESTMGSILKLSKLELEDPVAVVVGDGDVAVPGM